MSDPDATADGDAAATPPPATPARPRPVRGRRRCRPLASGAGAGSGPCFLAVLALIVIAGLIAARISVNYYVITPGDATPVAQYIEVPPSDNHPLTGKILLTDVFVTQLNALNYLQYTYFDSDSEVVSGPDLLGPAPDEDQFLDQGFLADGPGPVLRHRGGAVPPRVPGERDQRRDARLRDRAGFPGRQGAARGPGDHGGQRHRHADRPAP